MVELRYLKEEINVGDGIDYEPKIVTKLQYRTKVYHETILSSNPIKLWGDWQDIPTEWINKESDEINKI